MITICDQRGVLSRNIARTFYLSLLLGSLLTLSSGAMERFVSPTGAGEAPYASWASAATNIQDAIDAAEEGDVVWVTNGVYASGGKAVEGDLTNRVVLDKALTVRSVHGPTVTMIQGAGTAAGQTGVRCAWLTNGAVLKGFTLQGGVARPTGSLSEGNGGGVWCASQSALVDGCVIRSNTASAYGGGTYGGTLKNCAIIRNQATYVGGGAFEAVLNNCTVIYNSVNGVYGGALTNCIVYFNGEDNYRSYGLSYCCTTPLPEGEGNISSVPQVLDDGIHLASTSPCRATGVKLDSSIDIDGQTWGNPPAIGCDDWQPAPVIGAPPTIQFAKDPAGFSISVTAFGQEPFACWWSRDGVSLKADGHYNAVHTTNLLVTSPNLMDAGGYQVVVSNAFGMATSPVTQLTVHCVNAAGSGSVPPFLTWDTAATNIQDAIEMAQPGGIVLVTNGLYAAGGKVMERQLTNRVALDKALLVQSVNGPAATTIQGAWDPAGITGPLAVRCAWLTNGAALKGFTLQGGATRALGDAFWLPNGGGVWCASSDALVANCVIKSNAAAAVGGGAYQGTLKNCAVIGNQAAQGGGGVSGSLLNNCTVIRNSGGGIRESILTNCIVYFNTPTNWNWTEGNTLAYCCTTPWPWGNGNISQDPQLLADGIHLANTSPCRAWGLDLGNGGDIDGQAWSNPPSIGCDEWQPAPLALGKPELQLATRPAGVSLGIAVAGQEPFTCWWTRDGVAVEEDGHYTSVRSTNLIIQHFSLLDAGGYQVVASNAFGMTTSAVMQVVVHCVDTAGTEPVSPYASWATAATGIQDAIDAAQPGDIVLVTNGVYATGGKVMAGNLTNRVVVDKAVLVQSVNGPTVTTIQGAWDPATINGPLAVRCAWLTNGATLSGFTLRGGATRALASPTSTQQMSGGGVWGASTNATVVNCLVVNNMGAYSGGGAYQVKLVNCTLTANRAVGTGIAGAFIGASGEGGAAASCNLRNCLLTGNAANNNGGAAANSNLRNCLVTSNSAVLYGGGAYMGTLLNCTVTGNTAGGYGAYSGAVASAALTNCIVYSNFAIWAPYTNYYSSTFSYCCTTPLPAGEGNIDADPQLLPDGAHLSGSSPCRAAGRGGLSLGADLDGQPWANSPSMGCDEWWPEPIVAGQPQIQLSSQPLQLRLGGMLVAGQEPFTLSWLKNGNVLEDSAHYSSSSTASLTVNGFVPADAGAYQLVASNAFGIATGAVGQVTVHCVDAASPGPVPPYVTWQTAATNIQEAIDVAVAGEFVLVTNGVYASGGKAVDSDLTNRVALAKPVTVMSVNGPAVTRIQGAWDPVATNGPLAVRCAWLTNGAVLSGFTLQGGATRATGSAESAQSGGGVWGTSTNAVVMDCVICTNRANYAGGGCYRALLKRCRVAGNSSALGGGANQATLFNCLVWGNTAGQNGGGTYNATLFNCTVTGNSTGAFLGGGVYGGTARNSIVYGNYRNWPYRYTDEWGGAPGFDHVCTFPPGSSTDINASPQFLDEFHLAVTSPCRGAGVALSAPETDLDGEPWANPPSIGCDEVWEAAITGPLVVNVSALSSSVVVGNYVFLLGQVNGRASRVGWSFGDGSGVTNVSQLSALHTWTNPGDYQVTFTAYNADNPGGVSTNLTIQILPLVPPTLSVGGFDGTNFSLSFSAQSGVNYVVEQTTNMAPPVSWQTVMTVSGKGNPVQITDTKATNAMRFYRVRKL